MLYLIPPFSDAKPAVMQLISRAGVSYAEAEKLHEVWPHAGSGAISIVAIPAAQLSILVRHADTLLAELPAMVTGVPGAFYTAEWNILAAALPAVPWSQLEGQLAKSGLLSNSTRQLANRGSQGLAEPALQSHSLGRSAPAASPVEEEEDFDESTAV